MVNDPDYIAKVAELQQAAQTAANEQDEDEINMYPGSSEPPQEEYRASLKRKNEDHAGKVDKMTKVVKRLRRAGPVASSSPEA